jgi:hypothetical protein
LAKNCLNTAVQRRAPITFVVGNESAGKPRIHSEVAAYGLGITGITQIRYLSNDFSFANVQ